MAGGQFETGRGFTAPQMSVAYESVPSEPKRISNAEFCFLDSATEYADRMIHPYLVLMVALSTFAQSAAPPARPNPVKLSNELAVSPPGAMKPTDGGRLAFSIGSSNEFVFATGVLRGTLRAGGRSKGLSSVIHLPTGTRMDSSMGLFSHYRVFSTGKRYGVGAWDWPSEAKLLADGSVEVRWPATGDRPFELSALYRWAAANTLDLQTTVVAKTDLPHFESFLASYFTADFTNALVCSGDSSSAGQLFTPAEKERGTWLAFPRDEGAIAVIRDGRWKLEPNPVDWVLLPCFTRPLAVRRAPATGLTALLMSLPGDCFAISTPHQTEAHGSTYLSLFGRDLRSGETALARSRLLIAPQLSEAEMVKAYEDYLKEAGGQ